MATGKWFRKSECLDREETNHTFNNQIGYIQLFDNIPQIAKKLIVVNCQQAADEFESLAWRTPVARRDSYRSVVKWQGVTYATLSVPELVECEETFCKCFDREER